MDGAPGMGQDAGGGSGGTVSIFAQSVRGHGLLSASGGEGQGRGGGGAGGRVKLELQNE